MKKILIIQTAFLGDLILTLPLVQIAKKHLPEYSFDIVVIPSTSEILKNNPLVNNVLVYDKRRSGWGDMYRFSKQLKRNR
ncbi:MAG: glycosyltransferase family 9 protein [Ignavibacteria bacterium]|nr:glycosyltransferase family 9 protein [Ignavibacteria bacterium]